MGKRRVDTIVLDGQELFVKSRGKYSRNDDIVKTGTGVHTPKQHREKTKQREKLSLREYCNY